MATKKDHISKQKFASTLIPAVRTADANGTGVDTQESVAVGAVAHVGASGDTLSGSVYVELGLEHSDDNSAWSKCANSEIVGAVTPISSDTGVFALIDAPGEASSVHKCLYIGTKRYVRVAANVVGASNGTAIAAQIVLESSVQPVA